MSIAEVQPQDEIKRFAKTLHSQQPDWVTFYREVLGLHGIVRQTFRTRDALTEFEQTDAYRGIQGMLTELRGKGPVPADPQEPTQVITVRLPKSLHEALREEAHENHMSINKLCISKLLQIIDRQMIPDKMNTPQDQELPAVS